MNEYQQYMTMPYGYNQYRNDERYFPALGLGVGFLGGLATGALLTPGPGFGRPQPYPYYVPQPYYVPYPYYVQQTYQGWF